MSVVAAKSEPRAAELFSSPYSGEERRGEPASDPGPSRLGGPWRSAGVLRQLGLLPRFVDQVIDRVRSSHGDTPPPSLREEFSLVRAALASFWRAAPRPDGQAPIIHVFVGPPGSGKTTALCKWLAKSVLAQGRSARVWRLDGRGANFPGLLNFHAEALGVPLEREWQPNPAGFELGFVDLPGLDPHDTLALAQLRSITGAQIHLVLNAAYDVSVQLAQARLFSALPVNDLIFTHLDEEPHPAKLWNILLGTNCTIRFLAGGQNIPGDFFTATADFLIPRQIGR